MVGMARRKWPDYTGKDSRFPQNTYRKEKGMLTTRKITTPCGDTASVIHYPMTRNRKIACRLRSGRVKVILTSVAFFIDRLKKILNV